MNQLILATTLGVAKRYLPQKVEQGVANANDLEAL